MLAGRYITIRRTGNILADRMATPGGHLSVASPNRFTSYYRVTAQAAVRTLGLPLADVRANNGHRHGIV